ncbi:hypothetical protein Tco_1387605, partial [Tanacetum coccineum]
MPLSFALSDFKADGSNRSGSGTHHFASPLNTIIPNEAELTTGGDGLILESVNRVEEDTYHNLDDVEDTTKVNSPLFEHSHRSQHSNPSDKDKHNVMDEPPHTHASSSIDKCHGVSSSSGGSHRQAFLRRNPGGDDIGSSLWGDVGLPVPFVPARNLTTHSILNDAESCRDMMINLATSTIRDQQNRLSDYQALQRSCQNKLSDDHNALQQVHLGCVGKEADLTEKLVAVEKERDDLLDKNQEREERIKQLEADLASKTSSLTEAEGAVSTLKGELECLTVDLSHAEIVRHNYVHQLFPTVFQRLLSSDEYKKSMSDVFNLAIAARWSKGVKVACSEEEAEAFLAIVVDYDPACKTTFMFEFDSLFNNTSCVPGNLRHLAIGSWTHLERLAFRVMTSLGHWRLDSSGASCVLGNVRHLAIGSWTHLEHLAFWLAIGSWTHPDRLTFWVMCVTWPLALGLIRSILRSG